MSKTLIALPKLAHVEFVGGLTVKPGVRRCGKRGLCDKHLRFHPHVSDTADAREALPHLQRIAAPPSCLQREQVPEQLVPHIPENVLLMD